MTSKVVYTINKVEHEFGLSKIRPLFPRMPELYLELLVNKNKVNPTLASEKYVHVYEPMISSEDSPNSIRPIPRLTSTSKVQKSVETFNHSKPNVPEKVDHPPSQQLPRKGTFTWESSGSMEPSPIVTKRVAKPVSSSPQASISSERYRRVKRSIISSYHHQKVNVEPKKDKSDNQSEHKSPPTIKEIKKTFGGDQGATKPNITRVNDYETSKDEDDQKRELLFKFHRLKKTYPKANLPDFNMMSNHESMKRTYESTIKHLAIDSTVESYKSYLMIGFMICEIGLGKVGFDMEGYTQQQTLYMNKYEKLLIELGEKSYVPASVSKWPVEIRLMALFIFQTVVFIISKTIAKWTNFNVLQMYNSVNGAYEASTPRQQSMSNGASSGFASGGSSPLTFIPKTKRVPSTTSEGGGRMKGPSATKD